MGGRMAVQVDAAKVAVFEQIFAQPHLDHMHQLDPDDFEQFVAYVFRCAGYIVEHVARTRFPYGPGVDLNLHVPSAKKPVARVEVRRYAPSNLLTFDDLAAFVGKLKLAGDIPCYMVTTS